MPEPAANEGRRYIVVAFGSGPAEPWCKLSHCPMHAHGPYSREEAERVAERMPDWMQPHILDLADDVDACIAEPGDGR